MGIFDLCIAEVPERIDLGVEAINFPAFWPVVAR
jgi:hypothetical protein